MSTPPVLSSPWLGLISHLLTQLAVLLKFEARVAMAAQDDCIVALCLVLRDRVQQLSTGRLSAWEGMLSRMQAACDVLPSTTAWLSLEDNRHVAVA